jgi:hypothetical protein
VGIRHLRSLIVDLRKIHQEQDALEQLPFILTADFFVAARGFQEAAGIGYTDQARHPRLAMSAQSQPVDDFFSSCDFETLAVY